MKIATKDFNLKTEMPDLASEWHPTKNGDLTPDKVVPGSGKRVWWKCKNGHEWITNIYGRSHGTECPYCLGMRPSKEYNLKSLKPEIAAQWHPTKNGKLKPEDVTPGSERSVWWQCKKGHEWKTVVYNRRKYGCPTCSHDARLGKRKIISIREYNPEVAAEWHPTKNGDLTPDNVSYGSKKVPWWRCEEGHEWQQEVKRRTKGVGCPYCSGQLPSKDYNFKISNPEAAKEWHPTKNGNLKPEDVTPGSDRRIWWMCKNGHEWRTEVWSRKRGGNCPYCLNRNPIKGLNLKSVSDKLAKEWHPFKNGKLNFNKIPIGSEKKYWWKCKNDHEWRATLQERKEGSKCPECPVHQPTKQYNFKALHPITALEWHPTKNDLNPEDVTPGSERDIWWLCSKGHEWRTKVYYRSKGSQCPICLKLKRKKKQP